MEQRRTMGTKAVSRMLSTHLYYRRGFPFYTFNIVGGLDEEGACATESRNMTSLHEKSFFLLFGLSILWFRAVVWTTSSGSRAPRRESWGASCEREAVAFFSQQRCRDQALRPRVCSFEAYRVLLRHVLFFVRLRRPGRPSLQKIRCVG